MAAHQAPATAQIVPTKDESSHWQELLTESYVIFKILNSLLRHRERIQIWDTGEDIRALVYTDAFPQCAFEEGEGTDGARTFT